MIYYKAKLVMAEEGMQVVFHELHQIHETECFSYCIAKPHYPIPEPLKISGESDLKAAKRLGRKIYRVHRQCSRIGFKTKEKAFNNLLFLKNRQIAHMKRDIDLLSYFINRADLEGLDSMPKEGGATWYGDCHTLPDSSAKLCQYYHFD